MKMISAVGAAALLLAGLTPAGVARAQSQTNTITTPGGSFAFTVNGGPVQNPTITLQAGVTNYFIINTTPGFHPVVIRNSTGFPFNSDLYAGANPQNVTTDTILLQSPSSGFPSKLYYQCSIHGFFGEIDLEAPFSPIPPQNRIVAIQVGTNVVMLSTGTNTTWQLAPEFSSNLNSGVWAPVPAFSNTFANGTNRTVFNRLDPICGPNVFLRVRQSAP
jgi:hypothetical protein